MSAFPWRFRPRGLYTGLALLGLGLMLTAGLVGCKRPPDIPVGPATKVEELPLGPPLFEEVTETSGIKLTYRNGEEAGHLAILESLGGGITLFDYDGDGLLDVYVAAGGYFNGKEILGYPGKLFRNLGNWKFQDVTEAVGLAGPVFYSHGAAACDYDRDGWPDLLVTGWGRVALYHNEPDGKGGRRFVEVTDKAGLGGSTFTWATSAAWGDLDGDGFPDLYVCQYCDWSFANHPTDCNYDGKTRDVCPPKRFKSLPHKLFRNKGDGTFENVSDRCCVDARGNRTGLAVNGKGLAVLMVDLNGDGKPEIYIANDTDDKFLYLNLSTRGEIRLKEVALDWGVAVDDRSNPNGSMGLDAGDFNRTGRPSLIVTNYENELPALYRNDGTDFFPYSSQATGLGAVGINYVGWGVGFLDVQNRGWEDLLIINGHVVHHPHTHSPRRQLPLLLRNNEGKFAAITPRGGSYFRTPHCGRGVALGDLDNDGWIDFIVSHENEPVSVVRNVAPRDNHWLGVQLAGKDHRDVVGAWVTLEVGDRKLTKFARGGGSYASTHDRRLVFGLGSDTTIKRLEVKWPWGEKQSWENLGIDRYWRLVEGHKDAEEPARRK
jgi:hypothetical protein